MSAPNVDVLGVYSLKVTDNLFKEQLDILYGYPMSKKERVEAERQCREQLSSVVLIEVMVRNRDSSFKIEDFTQPQNGVDKSNWQALYLETYLTPDGETIAVERYSEPPKTGDLRIAFFLHFWQPAVRLRTSYGDVECPPVSEMPERLSRLVPYEPMD